MNQTRYCSTCGTLLTEGAVICGECGARYQASPYERRATDAPGAWSAPPRQRARETGEQQGSAAEEEGIELITADSLRPAQPGATALRSEEQYDRVMVTQPPMNPPGQNAGAPGGPGSPAPGPDAPTPSAAAALEPPLDGCAPASPLKRFLAALIDSVISSVVSVPLLVGVSLLLFSEDPGLLPQILVGVGVAVPLAYHLVMIWLVGSKGFTLGKLALGLRVTRGAEGGPLGFVRALGRWFLYGLIPPLMALSIFLDPRKHLRGFHDRAIDSVVTDVKEGRDPMKPRPDDFERAGAEHYLGEPSVAVSAHENLMAEPGAAWRDQGSAPAQPAGDAAQQPAPSPYAPQASAGSAAEAPAGSWGSPSAAPQGTDGGWAPPPVEPMPSAPSSWDAPADSGQPSWGQPVAQDSWGQSQAQESQAQPAAQESWGQPSAQESWGQHSAQESWGEPPAQESWGQPSAPQSAPEPAPAPKPYSAPEPAPAPEPYSAPEPAPAPQDPAGQWGPPPAAADASGAPGDITGDAWGETDDSVDEETRMSVTDDLGDIEATRISPAHLPPVKKVRLTTDDGAERVVDKAVVVGRNPAPVDGELLFVMKDDTRSVSKTHLRVDGSGEDLVVTDLGSTNGSTILREDGSRENLVPETPTVLPAGARVTLGDRTLSVERVQ